MKWSTKDAIGDALAPACGVVFGFLLPLLLWAPLLLVLTRR